MGSLSLLPTPRTMDGQRPRMQESREGWGATLGQALSLLPTPHGMAKEGQARRPAPTGNELGRALTSEVKLLPTPRASLNELRSTGRTPSQDAGTHGKYLVAEVLHLLPTPVTGDSRNSRQSTVDNPRDPTPTLSDVAYLWSGGATTRQSGDGSKSTALRLSPWFVEWMIGAPPGWSDSDCLLSAMEFKSRSEGSPATMSSGWKSNESYTRRENMPDLTLPVAKGVIDKAIQFEAFNWDNPADATDEAIMTNATKLVDIVTQASQTGSVSDAVLEILHVTQIEPLSEVTKEAYVARFGGETNGHAPTAQDAPTNGVGFVAPAPSEGQGSQSSVSHPPGVDSEASAQSPENLDDVFGPGYDDLKVADIKKAILASAASGDLSEEEWEKIKAYEAAHEERKSILSLQPEFKAPEPEPAPEPELAVTTGPVTMTGGAGVNLGPVTTTGDSVKVFYAGDSPSIARQENLPLPEAVDASQSPPMLPIKITDVGDSVLSDLSTQFHSYYTRTLWLLSQEEGRRDMAEHLEREAERDAYIQAYEMHKSAIPEEKASQPTALEAARKAAEKDSETAGPVRHYRDRKIRHSAEARELKALSIGFDKSMFRIKDELERRGLSSRSSASVK
jgi:hypothetical protein